LLGPLFGLNVQAICSPKRRAVSELHGVASQETIFFIIIAVRTSNPTHLNINRSKKRFGQKLKRELKQRPYPCYTQKQYIAGTLKPEITIYTKWDRILFEFL
jgi:hypothetical protein